MPRQPELAARAAPAAGSSTWMRRTAAGAALVATLLAPLLAAWALLRAPGAGPGAGESWLLALAVALTCSAVGWSLWRQAALEASLRRAREEARAAMQLETPGIWRWEADAAQRLVSWRTPPGAGADDGIATGSWAPLWEIFGADPADAARLRERMTAGLPLQAQGVALGAADGTAGAARRFRLEGRPLTDAAGRVVHWIGTAQDLGAVEAQDHDRRLLQALLQALPLPVFELAGDDRGVRSLLRGNASAAQCLGTRLDDLPGLPGSDTIARLPQELRAAVAEAIAQAPSGSVSPPCPGWQIRLESLPAPNADGASASAERRWLLILVPAGRADAAGATAAAADAESFSYTVSHDLRAPVRVVEGFTRIVKEDYGRLLDRIGNDHLDRVLGAAARMNAMIDALLALAQLSSRPLSRQPVNLSQLAAYVVEDLRRQSPERKVAVHLEAGLQAQGDPTLLRVVLENLIGNAWKYSARTRQAQIWIERGQHAGQAVFTVRDNGAGFDMRFADRLFGVFQRLHSASDFPGTGIGLATVRRIVLRHGGEIWAESEVDRGSSFHFTIPPAAAAGA